ncbi:hypothetical protein CDAR_371561 [Caerostris darwini]|uniref:Uncharacterized protein n=1 Tax=Caerostris darwini TaxID=1538125 RepID=A0AAV4XAS3_9ARAC|nr:hypothetical protein CDAR_371561 [Caerostris darwini]
MQSTSTQQHCQHLCNELTLHSKRSRTRRHSPPHHEQSFGSTHALTYRTFLSRVRAGTFFTTTKVKRFQPRAGPKGLFNCNRTHASHGQVVDGLPTG